MKQFFILFATVLIAVTTVTGCAGNPSGKQNGSFNPVTDLEGTYTGTFPAASCPGIRMELHLQKEGTYRLTSVYLEEKEGKFQETGTYEAEEGILVLTEENGSKSFFRIEKEQLRKLTLDKEAVEGDTAGLYVLKKAAETEKTKKYQKVKEGMGL